MDSQERRVDREVGGIVGWVTMHPMKKCGLHHCRSALLLVLCLLAFAFPSSSWGAWQTLTGYAGWEVYYNYAYNGYTTDLYRYNGVNRFWYNQGNPSVNRG